jgi:hypothetical protein
MTRPYDITSVPNSISRHQATGRYYDISAPRYHFVTTATPVIIEAMTIPPSAAELLAAFTSGQVAGETREKLHEHDRRLDAINGSIDRLTLATQVNSAAVQAQTQAIAEDRAATLAVAEALKDARLRRSERSARRWVIPGRILLALGGLAAVATIIALAVTLAAK